MPVLTDRPPARTERSGAAATAASPALAPPPARRLAPPAPLPDLVEAPPMRWRLIWPLPALLAWCLSWGQWLGLQSLGVPATASFVCATVVGSALALPAGSLWRRLIVAAGFPLSFALTGLAAELDARLWLLPAGVLLLAYPMRAWRDAPLYPTPHDALDGLDTIVALPDGARVLDAGCGLGHGLQALHRLWPRARLAGIEWSGPLHRIARLRCPWAEVLRGDMWTHSWSGCAVVYVFQRPESMARAAKKARAELAPGSWLVSLEFEIPGWHPHASLQAPGRRPVWIYAIRETDTHRPSSTTRGLSSVRNPKPIAPSR